MNSITYLPVKKHQTPNPHPTSVVQKFICLIFFLCSSFTLNAATDNSPETEQKITPLNLGLIPHLSSNLMIKKYSKLIIYLEDALKRPVIIVTAPNYKTYIQRCAEGKFDLYMTAPNMAAYHIEQNQHIPLAKFSNELRAVIAVRESSSYKTIMDLKGKTISAPDALSANALNSEITLTENGLNIEKDVDIQYTTSNNNPLFLLAENKVDAAITGLPGFKMISKGSKLKQPLRILKKSSTIPHMMFLSPQRVSEVDRAKFKNTLINITRDKTGKAFISGVPFGDLVDVTDNDLLRINDMRILFEKRLAK